MVKRVGQGMFSYEVDEEWAQLPAEWSMSAAAVAGDSKDRVYVFDRGPHPVLVFDRQGKFLSSWGEGLFRMPHAVYVDAEDHIWLVDRDQGQVIKFTAEGRRLMSIGAKGYRSDTGVPPDDFSSNAFTKVTRGGGPFNLPAGVAVASSGDIFVADGYANSRVHRFSPDGKLIKSWGQPGKGGGQFNLPHGIWIDRQDRVLVADRENDRVQVFSAEGELVSVWPLDLIGPAVIHVDNNNVAYIPEHNSGQFSVVSIEGDRVERVARWGSEINRSCHGAWVDSQGDVYVVQPGEFGRKRRVVKYHHRG
jgi:streptogramin lyase